MTGFCIADQGRPTFQRIVQGFRGATAVSSVSAGLGKLLMQGIENWLALLHTQLQASFNTQRFALLFDMVQLTDTRQCFQRHGTVRHPDTLPEILAQALVACLFPLSAARFDDAALIQSP